MHTTILKAKLFLVSKNMQKIRYVNIQKEILVQTLFRGFLSLSQTRSTENLPIIETSDTIKHLEQTGEQLQTKIRNIK